MTPSVRITAHFSCAPDSLPPFPAVALKALRVLSGTDSSLRELCDIVRNDTAFSAEILRVANSPLIAFTKEITSVLQAAMLLGFQRLRNLVITVGLREYLKDSFAQAMQSSWRHSVACAMLAERVAGGVAVDKDFVYSAGILHDIGRVALATRVPDDYARLLAKSEVTPGELLATELELFGIDHCEAGRQLVLEWELPRQYEAITSRHHEPFVEADGSMSVIQLSCALADTLGFTVAQRGLASSYEEVLSKIPERARKRFPSQAGELAAKISDEIELIQCT